MYAPSRPQTKRAQKNKTQNHLNNVRNNKKRPTKQSETIEFIILLILQMVLIWSKRYLKTGVVLSIVSCVGGEIVCDACQSCYNIISIQLY